MIKCESCRKGYNGRNGNGYSPCVCRKEPRPEYVEPPPLVKIGSESSNNADNGFILFAVFFFILGLIVGFFI